MKRQIATNNIYIGGIELKICNGCGQTKPLTDYQRCSKNRDGRTGTCKECVHAKANAKYALEKQTNSTYYQRQMLKNSPKTASNRDKINTHMNQIIDATKIDFTFTDTSIFYSVDGSKNMNVKNQFNFYDDGEPMCVEDKISHIKSFLLHNSNIIKRNCIQYNPEIRK